MNSAASRTLVILDYLVVWPIIQLYRLLSLSLLPLWYLLNIILVPFVHIGRLVSTVVFLPYRFYIKFENLIVYFSAATIVGVTSGLLLYALSTFLNQSLGLAAGSSKDDQVQSRTGRTLSEYRAARSKKKKHQKLIVETVKVGMVPDIISPAMMTPDAFMLGNGSGNENWQHGGPLSAQTILEENDSDFS